MTQHSRSKHTKYLWALLLALYISLHFFTLDRFPFVHSDESWLSGLTRNIAEKGDFSVTETFFDLKERHPHAIKLLFHAVQILFYKLMGYSVLTFRLISLCFGFLSLIAMYKLCRLVFSSKDSALLATALLAVDVQFIYASHFARQEVILLFLLLSALWLKLAAKPEQGIWGDIAPGILIGLSIGFHPNSFIIALPIGTIYLYEILTHKKPKLRGLAVYVLTIACFAALFVLISLSFNTNFFRDYAAYGSEFDVLDPLTSKITQIKDFYLKLYYGVSGTYYTPGIRFQFFVFGAALVLAVLKLISKKGSPGNTHQLMPILLSLAALNAGIILVGRFNQTSILFVFPLFHILTVLVVESLRNPYRYALVTVLLIGLLCLTAANYLTYAENSYDRYISEISKGVSPDSNTLGNLNAEFYFENSRLYDYRNLAYLKENDMTFEAYIRKNRIRYILYSEELELIHALRPKWDGIYGPLDYYDEMQAFLRDHCKQVHAFTDRFYGVRIVRYINTKDWQIRIYEVAD